jgi:hypothetical protein
MLGAMTDERHQPTDVTLLIDPWTRNVPGKDLGGTTVPAENVRDEAARILAERDARRGLQPPEATVRRVR